MALKFDDLRVLKAAEDLSDELWGHVSRWDHFARDVVGKQLARAADSIGANIAESFGRYHFGEKLQFLYYARGSLYETKYWINRARMRDLLPPDEAQLYAQKLNEIARQMNSFAQMIRSQKKAGSSNTLNESKTHYQTSVQESLADDLFDHLDLESLLSNR